MAQIPNKDRESFLTDIPDHRDTVQSRWILYALLIAVAYISVSFAFNMMLAQPLAAERLAIHEKVISEKAPKPVQYRILTYYTVEAAHRITGMSIWRLDLILRFVFTSLSLIFFFKFLRRWFGFGASASGPLILVALLPLTYIDYVHQPHDIPNLFFTILALTAIRDKKDALMIFLIPIAMINRESFIMVLWAWLFFNFDRLSLQSLLVQFALLALFAVIIYMALPYYFGPRENYVDTLQLKNNLDPSIMITWIIRMIALLGPLTLAACINFITKPLFLRRSMGFVAVFMIVNFLFGMYQESRLFLPILPVMIPLAMASVFKTEDNYSATYHSNSEDNNYHVSKKNAPDSN